MLRRGASAHHLADRLEALVPGLDLLDEQVERHVDLDRPGTAPEHLLKGLPHGDRELIRPRWLEAALHVWAQHGREVGLMMPVGLLERAPVELDARHIAGDGQHGRGIHHGGGDGHRQVRRARPAGGEGDGRPVEDSPVGVGHVAGRLLVMHGDRLNGVPRIVEGIQQTDIAVAAESEGKLHALAQQPVDDDLRACLRHRHGDPRASCRRTRGATRRGDGRRLGSVVASPTRSGRTRWRSEGRYGRAARAIRARASCLGSAASPDPPETPPTSVPGPRKRRTG